MARELFQAVQAAESNADLLIQEAQKSARELLKATEAEITENERKAALEQRAATQRMLDEKRESVRARLAASHPETLRKQEESLAQARARLDGAAKRIAERVWNDGNR
ncbi:MAG: hypothetical protein GX418_02190 [Clostridiales bacterium]|nr:hypothetical protein [Clostridiales bacterium]